MKYTSLNLNPSDNRTNDCVVRAIMAATERTWKEVFWELCVIASEHHLMPNDKKNIEMYLASIGWKKQKMPRKESGRRYTVEEFSHENKKGVFILSVVKHLTCLKNDTLIDRWDCGSRCVGNYWTK